MHIYAYICKNNLFMKNDIKVFKALSDETRLRIINLFIKTGKNLCVCELMDALKLPQYTISKSLQVLKNSNLLYYDKEGLWVYYKLNKETAKNKLLFNFLKTYLQTDVFADDEERINQRLSLRENDKCVVGIISEKELFRLIKVKK